MLHRCLVLVVAMLLALPAIGAEKDPLRIGVFRIQPELDRQKPLAAQDAAGWALHSGLLVGAIDKEWVGGFALQSRSRQGENDLIWHPPKISWWLRAPEEMTAPPGSFGGWVMMGFRNGNIKKVEAETGKVVWSSNLDSFTEREFALAGTTLYVLTAAQVLYAIDFQTGKTLWLYDAGFPDKLVIRAGARPLLHDGKIIFGVSNGEILAVNAQTGKLLWRYNPEYTEARFHDVVGELVMRNGRLLVTRYDGLVASLRMDGTSRGTVWADRLPNVTTSTFRNGRLYVGSNNGDVYAYDVDSGRKVWRAQLGESIGTLTAGEATLFVGGSNGRVTVLEAGDGDILWHDDLGGDLTAQPILVDDEIYFATGLKNIYAYRLR